MPEPGTIACGADGTILIRIGRRRYLIGAEDAKSLLFFGKSVPLGTGHAGREADGVAGRAAVNPSGRAVVLHTPAGQHIVALASFRRVARGEAHSAILSPCCRE